MNAHELTYNIIQDYIDSMVGGGGNPLTPRTKRNYWKLINTMIQFGVKRKCMSNEILEQVRGVDLPKDNPSEITICKPSEFEEMLKATRPELIPTLVLGGFAGIRTAEINRLAWADIGLEKRMVKIDPSKAKTRSRRIVPLCDAAIAWLTPYSARTGDVAYYAETNTQQQLWLMFGRPEKPKAILRSWNGGRMRLGTHSSHIDWSRLKTPTK